MTAEQMALINNGTWRGHDDAGWQKKKLGVAAETLISSTNTQFFSNAELVEKLLLEIAMRGTIIATPKEEFYIEEKVASFSLLAFVIGFLGLAYSAFSSDLLTATVSAYLSLAGTLAFLWSIWKHTKRNKKAGV